MMKLRGMFSVCMVAMILGLIVLSPSRTRGNDEPTANAAVSAAGIHVDAAWLEFGGFNDVIIGVEYTAFELDVTYGELYSQLLPAEIAQIEGYFIDYANAMETVAEECSNATDDMEQADFHMGNAITSLQNSQWMDAITSAQAAEESADYSSEHLNNAWEALHEAEDALEEIAFILSQIGR